MEATPEELALRDEAAAEAHGRIRADRARASERLQGLLAHLEEGRLDRRRGVELAHVALASLDAIADDLGEDLPNRKAEGLVCLANAYRLADDWGESENAFDHAQIDLRRAGSKRDPVVWAEHQLHKSGLRWHQHRFKEALELIDHAIPALRKFDQSPLLCQSLILKGFIYLYRGDPVLAIPEFLRGIEGLNEQDQPFLALSGYSGLANAYRLSEDDKAAEHALDKGCGILDCVQSVVALHQLNWSRALLAQEQGDLEHAESLLLRTISGLKEAGEMGYWAVAALDLALILAGQGRSAEILTTLARAVPALEALQHSAEARGALHLFRAAVEKEELTVSVLQGLRDLVADNQGILPLRARTRSKSGNG